MIMPLTIGEKIKILLGRRNMTLAQLAEKTGQSRQNMSNKMSRDNFSETEAKLIADALDCEFDTTFKMCDTGDLI
jgi:transcriptional regulator with XRE-family HTH domain